MKKTIRRIISVLLVLAMAVTSIYYTPRTVRAEVTEPEGTTSANVTEGELNAPSDMYVYDLRLGGKEYVVKFTDNDWELPIVEEDTKSFLLQYSKYNSENPETRDWKEVPNLDFTADEKDKSAITATIEASVIDGLELIDGEKVVFQVKEVITRTNAEETDTLYSAPSEENYFVYKKDIVTPITVDENGEKKDTGVAKIFVTTTRDKNTNTHDLLKSGDKRDVTASIVIKDVDGKVECADSGSIKLRGNSTSTAQKKPYNIKIASKPDLFGMGSAKKWSLLADAFDKSLLRNQIAMEFQREMESDQGNQFTSECVPADLYLDGHYLGTYLLIESVEAGETRVNIASKNTNNLDMLLELNSNGIGRELEGLLEDFENPTLERYFTINEPERPGTDASETDQNEWNSKYETKRVGVISLLQNFEKALAKGEGNYDDFSQYIDVDSFVNFYITSELFRTQDIDLSSTRFYTQTIDGKTKIYAGPLWDIDLSSGNDGASTKPDADLHAQEMPWFKYLMMNTEFQEKVRARYEEKLPAIKAIFAENGKIDAAYKEIKLSAEANYHQAYNVYDGTNAADGVTGEGWAINKVYASGELAVEPTYEGNLATHGSMIMHENYKEYVNDFKTWMQGRNSYLMKAFGASDKDATYTEPEDQVADRFYNLALRKNVELYKNCQAEGKKEYINDGSLELTNYCALTNADTTDSYGKENSEVYATVDLGAIYNASAIEQILIQYRGNIANENSVVGKPYSIQYSLDGIHFYDVVSEKYVESLPVDTLRTVDDVLRTEGKVRYVRVYYPRQARYGMQIVEIAVLDTDKDAVDLVAEDVKQPTFTVEDLPEDNKFKVNITDPEGVTDYTYDILIDGVITKSGVTEGEAILEVKDSGTYTISVIAYYDGFMSKETAGQQVTVTGTLSLTIEQQVADPRYNLMLNKQGIVIKQKNGQGSLSSLTDGKITDNNYCALIADENYNDKPKPGPVSITIDLEKYYKASSIEQILIGYSNYSAGAMDNKPYTISYSLSGRDNEFYQVYDSRIYTNKLINGYKLDDAEDFNVNAGKARAIIPEDTIRFVKIEYPDEVPAWGVQLTEVAVLASAEEEVEPIPVTAPTISLASNTDGQIDLTIKAAEGTQDYEYIVYIDGVEQTKEQMAIEGLNNYTSMPGIRTVTVQAFYNGFYSEKVSDTIRVQGTVEFDEEQLVNDPLYNLAYQQNASSDEPKAEGSIDYATDGNIKQWNNYTALTAKDGSWLQIELAEPYLTKSIQQVTVWYRSFINDCIPVSYKDYEIQFSEDGENFVPVPRTTAILGDKVEGHIDEGRYVLNDTIDTAEAEKLIPQVKFVRIVYNKTPGWGIQVREIALFNTEGNAEEAKWTQKVEPLTEDEIEKENVDNTPIEPPTEPPYWKQIGTSDYYYHSPEDVEVNFAPGAAKVLRVAVLIEGKRVPLQSVTYNGLPTHIDNTNNRGLMDVDRIRSYGIYKVEIEYNTETETKHVRTLYIRRENDFSYEIKGVTVKSITPNSVKVAWDVNQDVIDDGCTYNVILDPDTDNPVETKGVVLREYEFTDCALELGKHTVKVELVFNGKVVETATVSCESELVAKPDLAITNAKVECEELSVGKDITVIVTFKNVGLADAIMPVRTNDTTKLELAPNFDISVLSGTPNWGAGYIYLDVDDFTQEGENYVFKPGAEITVTMTGKIGDKQLWVTQEQCNVKCYFKNNKLDEYSIANNEMIIPLKVVPIPRNLKYTFNTDNNTATVTWDRPNDSNAEKTYTYNIYVNGEQVNNEPITDLSYFLDESDGKLKDGNNTVEVTSVLEGEESLKVLSTAIFNYSIDGVNDNWKPWKDNNNIDSYGNKWYYYDGYDWKKIDSTNSKGLVNNQVQDGNVNAVNRQELKTIKLETISNIIVNGNIYVSDNTNGEYSFGNNSCRFRQRLFKLEENEQEKIFAITLLGEEPISILFKVVDGNSTKVYLNNNDGVDVATWRATEGADFYEITYTVDDVSKTVKVEDDLTYEFRDADGNAFYPDNNTDVIVKAYTLKEDGTKTQAGNDYIGKALADLIITDVITPEAAAVGQKTTITVEYKNIGTAKATPATDKNYSILIRETVEDAPRDAYETTTNFIAPNETASIDITSLKWLRQAGFATLEVEVDNRNRVPEVNDGSGPNNAGNNKQQFQLYGISSDSAKLIYTENISEVASHVKVEWKPEENAESYYFVYQSNGQTVKYEFNNDFIKKTEDGGTLYMGIEAPLDNNTDFKVYAMINDKPQLIGIARALADLTIESVSDPVSYNGVPWVEVGRTFSVDVTIKNIGTGHVQKFVPEYDNVNEGYKNYTLSISVNWIDQNQKSQWVTNNSCTDGLAVGETLTLKLEDIEPTVETKPDGELQLYTYWVDYPGDDGVGYIEESEDRDNNQLSASYEIKPYDQLKGMDWTRLVSSKGEDKGEPYLFNVAHGSQTAYIDYKVIDSDITDIDYKDILKKYVGYAGGNMSIGFLEKTVYTYTGEDDNKWSDTRFEFAQLEGYDEKTDSEINAETIKTAPWINLATQGTSIKYTDKNGVPQTIPAKGSKSPVGYNGNGFNFYAGNFGLYKYYAMRLTNPVESEQKNVTVVFRVTDDKYHNGTWQQAFTSDRLSDSSTLPMYYCGNRPTAEKDSLHYIGNEKHEYYTARGALWYDTTDIKLSCISIYNGNWLAISTSQYAELAEGTGEAGDKERWKLVIARAEIDPDNNAFIRPETDPNGKEVWYEIDPNVPGSHLGIQGTNTVQVGLPWLFKDIPIHSSKGGQKDTEYYYIRIVLDRDNYDETDETTFIEIPVTLYADIPEIQPVQNATARRFDDEDNQSEIQLIWTETKAQKQYGYVYRVFIGGTQIDSEGNPCNPDNDVVYTKGQTLTFKADKIQSLLNDNKDEITVEAYWCEQEASTPIKVEGPPDTGWKSIEGEFEIEIQAGQNKFVDIPGEISYYYDIATNHANSVVGYNGYYISLNGNKKYYNKNSTVSVLKGYSFSKDSDIEDVIYDRVTTEAGYKLVVKGTPDIPTGEGVAFAPVEAYEYTDGQLQIDAKNLITASHETTWYLVKISSTETVGETKQEYVTYVMLKSVVHAEGDVKVRGYQMNTDATPGAVSEFGPSFRVVSRTGKVVEVDDNTPGYQDNKLISAVINQGTIYALNKGDINDTDMHISYDETSGEISTPENVYHIEATKGTGIIEDWSLGTNDENRSSYNYYAVTFKAMEYSRISLTTEYKVRAYAVTETGEVIYEDSTTKDEPGDSVKDVSIYRIAKNLYKNSTMPNETAHNYLYENVLNIVAISQNYMNIGQELLRAFNITSATDPNYQYVNAMYRDLYYYSYLDREYKYEHYMQRGAFTSKTKFDDPDNEGEYIENEILLLKALNGLNLNVHYKSTAEWVQANVKTNGFYTKQPYTPNATVKPGVDI